MWTFHPNMHCLPNWPLLNASLDYTVQLLGCECQLRKKCEVDSVIHFFELITSSCRPPTVTSANLPTQSQFGIRGETYSFYSWIAWSTYNFKLTKKITTEFLQRRIISPRGREDQVQTCLLTGADNNWIKKEFLFGLNWVIQKNVKSRFWTNRRCQV